MRTATVLKTICALLVVLAALRCADDPVGNNGGTGTGNAAIAGILRYESGTSASGVTVCVRLRNALPDTSGTGPMQVCVTTDGNGQFEIEGIGAGVYVIEGTDGNQLVFIDSVVVSGPDSTTVLPADTLKPGGSITGVIHLSEGGDPRKVFVLAFGLSRFALPDSNGVFTFDSLAEAAYDLRLLPAMDEYGVLDTHGIPVVSGQVTDLDTLSLPYDGIPTPKGLAVSYDTLKQIVTMAWNRADTNLVAGYNIYRQHSDSGSVRINTSPVTDTMYSDSSALEDQTYTYQVKALDRDGNEGLLSVGVAVVVVATTHISTLFEWATLNTPTDTVPIYDTVHIVVNYSNELRTNDSLFWAVGHPDSVVKALDVSDSSGTVTLDYSWSVKGEKSVYIRALDATGTIWTDSVSIYVSVWKAVSPMPTARKWLTSAFVNGKIYAIGGYSYDTTGYTGTYDPTKNRFLNTVEEYDPVNDSWTTRSPMPTPRLELTSNVVGGKIYAIGGSYDDSSASTIMLSANEEYDPQTDTWAVRAPMPTPRFRAASFVFDGKIYVTGGANSWYAMEVYDPAGDTWETKPSMPTPFGRHTISVVNGKAYFIGGEGPATTDCVEEYDPVAGTWATKSPMIAGGNNLTSSVVNGRIYVFGTGSPVNVQMYDPSSDTWHQKTIGSTVWSSSSACAVGDEVYLMGGTTGTLSFLNTVERYYPLADN